MARNTRRPSRVSLTRSARRSAPSASARHQALLFQRIGQPRDVAAGDHQSPRQLAHAQALRRALQLRHQIEARQSRREAGLQAAAHARFDEARARVEPQPQTQRLMIVAGRARLGVNGSSAGAHITSPPATAMLCPVTLSADACAQPRHRFGDLLRSDQSCPAGCVTSAPRSPPLRRGPSSRGCSRSLPAPCPYRYTRADGVYSDIPACELQRQRARQPDDSVLRGAVCRDIGIADQSRGARNVDDAPAPRLQHVGQRSADAVIAPVRLTLEHVIPELRPARSRAAHCAPAPRC